MSELPHAQEAQAQALEGKITFPVTATVTPRRPHAKASHHRGVLLISPDSIVFIAGGTKTLRFEHSQPTITLMRSGLRTHLLLSTRAGDVNIRVPTIAGRKLRRALKESDLKVITRTS